MRGVVSAVVAGAVWGAFCGVGNGWSVVSTLAQMAVPWLWIAAIVGYRCADGARHAAQIGVATLVSANVAYFAVGAIARLLSGEAPIGGVRFLVVWTSVGLVVGPAAGMIGRWLTAERTSLPAAAALAAASIAEPLALWAHIDHLDAHLTYLVVAAVGITIPVIRLRAAPRRSLRATAVALAVGYPAAVIIEVALVALGQISAPIRLA